MCRTIYLLSTQSLSIPILAVTLLVALVALLLFRSYNRTSTEGDQSMNEALRELAVRAGAPEAMLNEIWFHIFCQKLVAEVITEMEQDTNTPS